MRERDGSSNEQAYVNALPCYKKDCDELERFQREREIWVNVCGYASFMFRMN